MSNGSGDALSGLEVASPMYVVCFMVMLILSLTSNNSHLTLSLSII